MIGLMERYDRRGSKCDIDCVNQVREMMEYVRGRYDHEGRPCSDLLGK